MYIIFEAIRNVWPHKIFLLICGISLYDFDRVSLEGHIGYGPKKDKSDILIGLERVIHGYRGDDHKVDPANVEQVSSMYASFINGLSNEDKNTLGSMALMFYATSMERNDTKRPQQCLNLIDQLPALQEEGSLFNETRNFMKNTMSLKLEKGKDFGKDFDSTMAQKEMFDSGFPQKFMKSSLDFFKEHPEWKDSHFYKAFN